MAQVKVSNLQAKDLRVRLEFLDEVIASTSNQLRRLDAIQERIELRKKLSAFT